MYRFAGTNVVVTGAGSGIGRATVCRLVTEGAAVFALDRDPDGLQETAEAALGVGRVVTALVDVTQQESVAAAVQSAHSELGSIDALVNMVGTLVLCREVVPYLPDEIGVIVNVTSGAVPGCTEGLASELVRRGIRVLSISPGQLGPKDPEQIAATICFAASREASHLTGVDLPVDAASHN